MDDISNSTSLTPQENYDIQLRTFEKGLLDFIQQHDLPIDNILVEIPERVTVFKNVDSVIGKIEQAQKERSVYISKFIAAAASGLFDAALNYLWDETIQELRRRVSQYDLSYFYDNAVTNPDSRKRLSTEQDLEKIDDYDLIIGAKKIGLISEIGFKHLDYVRFMRNWASAAHPNQNQITGLQIISMLETCIKEVISLPLSNIAVEIKQLLSNIKNNSISEPEAKEIAAFFINLNQEQVHNLASGFFGIFTDLSSDQQTRENINCLLPLLWDRVDETTREQFGIRYGKFVANNDQQQKILARHFLDIVTAASYIPEDLRAVEIDNAIDNLMSAHYGLNNFYSEPPFARQLARLVGDNPNIPKQVNKKYIHSLIKVFLTNGNGIAWNAEPTYLSLIEKFNPQQAIIAILSFNEEYIASKLQFTLCKDNFLKLLKMMKIKISAPAIHELIDEIEKYKAPLDKMRNDSRLKQKVENLLKIVGD